MGLLLHSLELSKQKLGCIFDLGFIAKPSSHCNVFLDNVLKNGVINGKSFNAIEMLD